MSMSMGRMSTNSFLDNPLLKVSRAVAACSRCRKAKIRCDGKLPACSACERVSKAESCSSASDEFARGKERSYVASLEGYCERLEQQVAQLRQRQMNASSDATGAIQESSITSVSSHGTVAKVHRKEISDIDDLVGDFGFLSVNATSRDFQGIKSNTSFANLMLSVSTADRLPHLPRQRLPAQSEANPLLQYYFDNIFIQLPFFVETSFWTSVGAVYQSGGRFAKPFDHWIVRMVMAIATASLSLEDGDPNSQRARALVSEALQYAEEVCRPGSISGIQAILLLAQYSLVDPKHFRCWYLVAMAARVMVDLGLHQDPPSEVTSQADRLDLRRRVFHCIYCLDRYVSPALGRAFSFSDESANVALPESPAPASPFDGQVDVFLKNTASAFHLVKVRQILSVAYQEMFYNERDPQPQPLARIWTLCARVREWFEDCPPNGPHHFPLLCRLELLYTTVTLLCPCPKYHSISDFSKVLLFDRCMDYVNQLHQVVENPSALPFLTIIDVHRGHQIGLLFVDILTKDYDLLLRPTVPAAPSLPPGTPEPPYIGPEDRFNCAARALRCLDYMAEILQHCTRKWAVDTLRRQFEQASGPIRRRLMQTHAATGYSTGGGSYEAWPAGHSSPPSQGSQGIYSH